MSNNEIYPKCTDEETANALDLAVAPHDTAALDHTAEARALYHAARESIKQYRKYKDAADLQMRETLRLADQAQEAASSATAAAANGVKEAEAEYIRHKGDPAQAPKEADQAAKIALDAAMRARIYAGRVAELITYEQNRESKGS